MVSINKKISVTVPMLTGRTMEHLVELYPKIYVQQDVKGAIMRLSTRAEHDGFSLRVASAFRSFDAQLKIWNEKCQGQRPVLDKEGRSIDIKNITDEELLFSILRWSALPGASRHHWGTDLDVFDAKAVPPNYCVKFTPDEGTGLFSRFSRWLSENAMAEGFFLPYRYDQGGVCPEWWHISFAPIAQVFFEALTTKIIDKVIRDCSEIALQTTIQKHIVQIVEKYVRNINLPIVPSG